MAKEDKQPDNIQALKARVKELEGYLKTSEKYAQETQANYKELIKAFDEMQGKYKAAAEEKELEKSLKNEAYAFILSSGVLDNFLSFTNELLKKDTRANVITYLVDKADPDGKWLDR